MSDAAFEAALRTNPDDFAGWCAYADYLVEQGDPRGEFMQAQLALEDESRPKAERDALKAREAELLAAHERAWLGDFAPFVFDQERDYEKADVRFVRGWPSEVSAHYLSVEMVRALGRSPASTFLTRLLVDRTAYEEPSGSGSTADGYFAPGPDVPPGVGQDDAPALHALLNGPLPAQLRVFRYGEGSTAPGFGWEGGSSRANGESLHEAVARMPRLEELYLYAYSVNAAALFALPLMNLRVLRVDHKTEYPFEVLADNPALGKLTHVLAHPHAQRPEDDRAYIRLEHLRAICRSPHLPNLQHLRLMLTDFGDEGAEEVVSSGVLRRLRVLELAYGCMRDRGALALAAAPDLKNLALLDLEMNALTESGIAALQATGVHLKSGRQHGEHPDTVEERGWLEYLSNGDWE